MSQAYDYIFEMLEPGKTWLDYGVFDVVTTSENQKEYIQLDLMAIKKTIEELKLLMKFFKVF